MDPQLILQNIQQYQYAILAPAAFLFGPIVSLAAGMLLRVGTLELLPTALALAAGELTGDILWYWLGSNFGDAFVRRFGKYVSVTEERIELVKAMYQRHHSAIIISSKLFAGFGIAPVIFFTAGLSRIPFARYMSLTIIGQIIWTTGLLSIGYYLGHLYTKADNLFDRISLIVFIIVALVIVQRIGSYYFAKMQKK